MSSSAVITTLVIAITGMAVVLVIGILWACQLLLKIAELREELREKEITNKMLVQIMAKRKRRIEKLEAKGPSNEILDWRRFVKPGSVILEPTPGGTGGANPTPPVLTRKVLTGDPKQPPAPAPVNYMDLPVGTDIRIDADTTDDLDETQIVPRIDFELTEPVGRRKQPA